MSDTDPPPPSSPSLPSPPPPSSSPSPPSSFGRSTDYFPLPATENAVMTEPYHSPSIDIPANFNQLALASADSAAVINRFVVPENNAAADANDAATAAAVDDGDDDIDEGNQNDQQVNISIGTELDDGSMDEKHRRVCLETARKLKVIADLYNDKFDGTSPFFSYILPLIRFTKNSLNSVQTGLRKILTYDLRLHSTSSNFKLLCQVIPDTHCRFKRHCSGVTMFLMLRNHRRTFSRLIKLAAITISAGIIYMAIMA